MKKLSVVCLFAGLQVAPAIESWRVDSQEEWAASFYEQEGIEVAQGLATPTEKKVIIKSALKSYEQKRSAKLITISQSPIWMNWNSAGKLLPSNLGDAPVLLNRGEEGYWAFGRYSSGGKKNEGKKFVAEEALLEGFDVPLKTTPFEKQYDAPGAAQKSEGGYHAWQSKDMVNWVHHGPISDHEARWMTSAEEVDGKVYFYYDFPNDQDPHLIIDEDLTDGKIGKKMGMAFKDPSHGSDSAIIRDLDGQFHLIIENWDPIHAQSRSWDSPLASHAVSKNGIDSFELKDPAVDYRTKPTGEMATYTHPHWKKEDPNNYPSNRGEYEIHKPEQNAYGDWAAISIGGQYYLFGDYDPAGTRGKAHMSVGWFTSGSIDEPFTWCSNIGKGHPDPDIMFAEGQFYLATQTRSDYISPGPWVDGVEVRVGVDTDGDKVVDEWTEWHSVKESYELVPGFSKQVSKTPAQLGLSVLSEGFGFQFEIRLADITENEAKPILDRIQIDFK